MTNTPASISFENHFEYSIKRQRRKTLALHILADASVEVRAPKWLSRREISNFVEERREWVIEQRREQQLKRAERPVYKDGQSHYYLGVRYPLKVSRAGRAFVRLVDDIFFISVRDPSDPAMVQTALESWYRRHAEALYRQRLEYCYRQFPAAFRDRYPLPEFTIRRMRRRWGSCSSSSKITLNLLLMRMPLSSIDYVIVHELCHLAVFNHSRAFYQLMAGVMPDWPQQETIIKSFED